LHRVDEPHSRGRTLAQASDELADQAGAHAVVIDAPLGHHVDVEASGAACLTWY
jgi:hypothetical protein